MSGRAFVTGGAGFAGRHLLDLLPGAVAPSRDELDLLDADALRAAVRESAPDAVWHLAALASVGRSWEAPAETIADNVAMTVNLLEAVRTEAPAGGRGADQLRRDLRAAASGCRSTRTRRCARRTRTRSRRPPATCSAASTPTPPACAWCACAPSTTPAPARATTTWSARSPARWPRPRRPGATRRCVRTGNPDSARDFSDVRDVARAYVAAAALEPGRLQRRQRPGGERARADRAGARGRAHPGAPRGRPGARARRTTCPRCAARQSGCGPPPAGRPRSRSSRPWPTPSTRGGRRSGRRGDG